MKSTFRFVTVIIALNATITFAKTSSMTANYYKLAVNKIDSSIIGTWEMHPADKQTGTLIFCQFNANSTFISFEYKQGKYIVTGRGKWLIMKERIYIIHGTEKPVPVQYESAGNRLVFGEKIVYTKTLPALACK